MRTPKETYDAFRTGMLNKTDAWKHLLAENVILAGPLAQVKGEAAFIEINTPFFSSIKSSELHQCIESGNYIITRISTTLAVPSGKVITLEVSEWYEIKDGLIHSLQTYFDTEEFRREMMGEEQ